MTGGYDPYVDFTRDVHVGLSRHRKFIPCKYLYDARGCALFDAICDLPEYYLTRTELAVLACRADEVAALAGPASCLIEYGGGSLSKVRPLLDSLKPNVYVPVDIAHEHLLSAARRLEAEQPWLSVVPVAADFLADFALPPHALSAPGRRLGFFPGSTIGNLRPREARRFLARVARLVGSDGGFLIGVDLCKEADILEPAYDDGAGVTAAFSLNLLARINRELGGDFELDLFRHRAHYNPRLGRVEIHLVSQAAHHVTVDGRRFAFGRNEAVLVEYSYKYTVEGFQALARSVGWRPVRAWTDPYELFSIHYLSAS